MTASTTTVAPNGAIISDCKRYRYKLWRQWDNTQHLALWIMLNPSTADATDDDPTIRKCCGFARQWKCGGIVVVNLFAWRATKPRDLPTDDAKAIGELNDVMIRTAVENAIATQAPIVAGWGTAGGKRAAARAERLLSKLTVFANVQCLRLTKDGHPGHPLYIPYSATLQPLRKEATCQNDPSSRTPPAPK